MKSPKQKVLVVLTPGLINRLDQLAECQTASRSLVVRKACEQYLREIEAKEGANRE